MTLDLPLPWTLESLWLLVQIGAQLSVPVIVVSAILLVIARIITGLSDGSM